MFRVTTILILSALSVQSKELPEAIKKLKCSISHDFETCFIKNGNLAIPLVARGIPDYHIPKMNPLEMPFLNLISTPSMSLNLTQLKVYGLENLQIVNSRLSWNKLFLTVMLKGQNITLDGQYDALGKIMIMPIKGTGHMSVFLKNGVYKATISGSTLEKDGDVYYNPSDVRVDYNFEKIEFNFDNLFDGNKQLGDQINQFLNENWDLLVLDFGPGISKTISSIITNVLRKFTAVVPVKFIFDD